MGDLSMFWSGIILGSLIGGGVVVTAIGLLVGHWLPRIDERLLSLERRTTMIERGRVSAQLAPFRDGGKS